MDAIATGMLYKKKPCSAIRERQETSSWRKWVPKFTPATIMPQRGFVLISQQLPRALITIFTDYNIYFIISRWAVGGCAATTHGHDFTCPHHL